MSTTTMTKVASTNNSDILNPIGLNTLNKLFFWIMDLGSFFRKNENRIILLIKTPVPIYGNLV